jgi:hypothetical protein
MTLRKIQRLAALPPASISQVGYNWRTPAFERPSSIWRSESPPDETSTIASELADTNVCILVRECVDFGERPMEETKVSGTEYAILSGNGSWNAWHLRAAAFIIPAMRRVSYFLVNRSRHIPYPEASNRREKCATHRLALLARVSKPLANVVNHRV